jgi:hypothetical protein
MGIYNSFYKWTPQDIEQVIELIDIASGFTTLDVANKISKQYPGSHISSYYLARLGDVMDKMVDKGKLTKTIVSTQKTDGGITENKYSWK